MISALALATVLAQPCMSPHVAHGHRKHPAPAQSCITPPVPMCFREPAPEPDLLPVQAPLLYYVTPPTVDAPLDAPYIPSGEYYLVGGGETVGPLPLAPPPPPTQRAPEVSAVGAVGALTLLLGFVAVLRGRHV
jgi:hypothetical protein